MGLPDDAMDDSDAESRCPRDSDGELAADMDVGFMGSLEPEGYDEIAGMLLQQLGAQGRRYRRESRRALRGLVSEIYSPPRITTELRRGRYKYLAPGLAFDVTVKDPDDGQPCPEAPARRKSTWGHVVRVSTSWLGRRHVVRQQREH